LIIPIHKKGGKSDASNYRGITLLSNFSKLFTSVLNNRISLWREINSKIFSDAQFGFRKGISTIDASFILHSIINKFLNEHNELLEAVDHFNYLGITFNYTWEF